MGLLLAGSTCLALAGSGAGSLLDPRDLWFWGDMPLGTSHAGYALPRLLGCGGLLLLLLGWLVLGLAMRRGSVAARGILVAVVLTALPLLVAPPLTSSDAYTYVGVGQLLRAGHDPYAVGWGSLSRPDYARMLDPFWRNSPAPYSPLVLRLLQGVAAITGGNLLQGVLVLRALAVLALAGCAALLVGLARGAGREPAPVLWLAVANPLVLLSCVSAAHLDVLMVWGLLAALALYRGGRPVPALVLVGLAAQVKVVALLLALVLALDLALRQPSLARRVGRLAGGLAVAAVTFSLGSLVSGLGWGWLRALSSPGRADTSLTPVDAVWDMMWRASLVATRPTGQHVQGAPTTVATVALVLAVALAIAAAARVTRLGVERATGLGFAAVALLGGVLWPWYALWPVVFLALAGTPRERAAAAGLSGLLLVSLLPGGVPVLDGLPGPADLLYLSVYAGLALVALTGLARTPAVPSAATAAATGDGGSG